MELELLSISAFSDPLTGALLRRALTEYGLLLIIGGIIYFLPTIIVLARGRNDGCGIFLVNLFFGATVIGWVIALIWSLSGEGKRR